MNNIMAVNDILRDRITKITYTMTPTSFQGDVRSHRIMQGLLMNIIDDLGLQSTQAQFLYKTITSSAKMLNNPDHILYLMKNNSGNGGQGEVVGFIKVGRKKLFLHDKNQKMREIEPLCVLDFYIIPKFQRQGLGRELFDYMLKDCGVQPQRLAIDSPSPRLTAFMGKHYNMKNMILQVNNFAVDNSFFDGFYSVENNRGNSPLHVFERNTTAPRLLTPHPGSTIGSIIHGDGADNKPTDRSPSIVEKDETPVELEVNYTERPSTLNIDGKSEPKVEILKMEELKITTEELGQESKKQAPSSISPAGSTISRRDSQVTEQGFFDIKFYHSKLW